MSYCNKYIVDIKQLKLNCKILKETIGTKLCAVVKANAYGVGLRIFAEALKNRVDYFAVACFCEAFELRKYLKIDIPILILGIISEKDVAWCSKNNICVNVSSFEMLKSYRDFLQNSNHKLKIHVKINTGLNRYGITELGEFEKILNYVGKYSNKFELDGIFTHFATKSNDTEFIKKQNMVFNKFTQIVKNECINIHNCNSYASLQSDDIANKNSMIRVGWALHGNIKNEIGLKPILKIHSQVLFIRKVKKGESIGYDRAFIARANMRVAIVGIGYADGLDRNLSNNFSLLIDGKYCPIVGLICMDCCIVDVTNVKGVAVGDSVVILGNSGGEWLTLDDYSKALNKSPYAIQLEFNYKRMQYICLNGFKNKYAYL